MADQEIIKHTKKVYKIWNSQEHSAWQKVKEFLFEIFIIVFAVSLSIWLHSWSEHSHEQKDVNQFLQDLKTDLIENNKLLEKTKKELSYNYRGFNYFFELQNLRSVNKDSIINEYLPIIQGKVKLIVQKSQYEGYKFSGKLNKIENKKLAKKIIELYQKDIFILENNFQEYNRFHDLLQQEVSNLVEFDINGNTQNFDKILINNKVRIYLLPLAKFDDVLINIDDCLKKSNNIILEIDKENKK